MRWRQRRRVRRVRCGAVQVRRWLARLHWLRRGALPRRAGAGRLPGLRCGQLLGSWCVALFSAIFDSLALLHVPSICTQARAHTGTALKRSSGDPCLRSKNLIVNDETCPYHIEGVSGGPVLYPEQVTGVPKTRDGRDNVAYTLTFCVCARA